MRRPLRAFALVAAAAFFVAQTPAVAHVSPAAVMDGEFRRPGRAKTRLVLQAVAALVYALDQKDNYTAGHSEAVAQWAGVIAAEMGLGKRAVQLAHLAGLVHDVGKIGIPDRVLQGTGPLCEADRAQMNTHPQRGCEILGHVDEFRELALVVLYHHERYDGGGYPLGVAGEEIPLLSRIIAVADAYSAMTTDRPYRARLDRDAAMGQLRRHRGTQFDPLVVDCFLDLLERVS